MFSDCRPYHRQAVRVARRLGIVPLIFELGYLRPNWVTMEHGGVNGSSDFPRDREIVEKLAPTADIPELAPGPSSVPSLVFWEILLHLANSLGAWRFPRYVRHRTRHPVTELAGWARKGLVWRQRKRQARETLAGLISEGSEFFFYPLQLEHDHQISRHSSFSSIRKAMKLVFSSFAEDAPRHVHLLVKNHPLDNFLIDRQRDTLRLAKRYGIGDRVHYIETGHNPTILEHAKGVVTINSTLGISALVHGLPVFTLGSAIYNLRDLTHSGSLSDFWSAPQKPDRDLFVKFRRLLIERTQVQGLFEDLASHDRLVSAALRKIFGYHRMDWNEAHNASEDTSIDAAFPNPALVPAE
jgi:capsular polysaccharide export protein